MRMIQREYVWVKMWKVLNLEEGWKQHENGSLMKIEKSAF